MTYAAPVDDMRFVLDALCDLDGLADLPKYAEVSSDLVQQILSEAGKVAAEILAPLNQTGDRQGAVLENGVVRTAEGFRDAYLACREGGWPGLAQPAEHGGMGLPGSLAMAVQEMWQSANMGFALCPMLTQSAALALDRHGTEQQKRDYLPKLVTGEWSGAMDLTEPQAGSDVGALKTKAVPEGDHYRITGQKIFISYGDHDLTDNILHLVLARTPDAPPGTKGISLFLVPKYPLLADGSLGPANDLRAVSLEEKLGIHASPTAVMSFGDNDGAIGYLVGEEHGGMACMFTMMNITRLGVGIQGLAIAERAYQRALDYAKTRIQSPLAGAAANGSVPIIKHPDVRRMLWIMRAQVEAMRALSYTTGAAGDFAEAVEDPALRRRHADRLALLTPVVKAWCSDVGFEVASTGVQIHGGAGFIEEAGAAQHLRDVRITSIYEGTNGIQAQDLMSRKILRDRGAALGELTEEMRSILDIDLADIVNGDAEREATFARMRERLAGGLDILETTTAWILDRGPEERDILSAAAVPFLHLMGTVVGGWLMLKSAGAAASAGPDFAAAKLATASYYMANVMPRCGGLAAQVVDGAAATMAMDESYL